MVAMQRRLELDLLGKRQSVIDFDAKVENRQLRLGTLELQACPDCPDISAFKDAFDPSAFPCSRTRVEGERETTCCGKSW
jgi:hypothetical protein